MRCAAVAVDQCRYCRDAAVSNAATEGDYAFCVTVRDGALVVAHVPPIAADATSAALIDEAVKRLDFVALLRHVVDARAHVSLASVARAVSHVLAEQRSLSAEPIGARVVAVLRAASSWRRAAVRRRACCCSSTARRCVC
jgi:hypothetical protein